MLGMMLLFRAALLLPLVYGEEACSALPEGASEESSQCLMQRKHKVARSGGHADGKDLSAVVYDNSDSDNGNNDDEINENDTDNDEGDVGEPIENSFLQDSGAVADGDNDNDDDDDNDNEEEEDDEEEEDNEEAEESNNNNNDNNNNNNNNNEEEEEEEEGQGGSGNNDDNDNNDDNNNDDDNANSLLQKGSAANSDSDNDDNNNDDNNNDDNNNDEEEDEEDNENSLLQSGGQTDVHASPKKKATKSKKGACGRRRQGDKGGSGNNDNNDNNDDNNNDEKKKEEDTDNSLLQSGGEANVQASPTKKSTKSKKGDDSAKPSSKKASAKGKKEKKEKQEKDDLGEEDLGGGKLDALIKQSGKKDSKEDKTVASKASKGKKAGSKKEKEGLVQKGDGVGKSKTSKKKGSKKNMKSKKSKPSTKSKKTKKRSHSKSHKARKSQIPTSFGQMNASHVHKSKNPMDDLPKPILALARKIFKTDGAILGLLENTVQVDVTHAGVQMTLKMNKHDDATTRLGSEGTWFSYDLDTLGDARDNQMDMLNMIDVGGNYGVVTIAAMKKYPKFLRVVAVEPIPLTYFYLKWNLLLNGVPEIENESGLLGKHPGVLALNSGSADVPGQDLHFCSYPWSSMNSKVCDCKLGEDNCELVPSTSVDKLAGMFGKEPIAMVKMDCEGCEFKCLPALAQPHLKDRVRRLAGELHIPDDKIEKLACGWDKGRLMSKCQHPSGRKDDVECGVVLTCPEGPL